MVVATKPNPHPAKQLLSIASISGVRLAAAIGQHPSYVAKQLAGVVPVSPQLRRTVGGLLAIPEAELFHPEDGH